jgi:hypothetical protein
MKFVLTRTHDADGDILGTLTGILMLNGSKNCFSIITGLSFSIPFSGKENAYRYLEELKKKHGIADVHDSWVKNTRYYRVRLGRFSSLSQAQASIETYEGKGFKGCFVVAVD